VSADRLVQFLRQRLNEEEGWARTVGGNTVVGEPGRWTASPDGDRWAPSRTDCEVELLVALRPDAPQTHDGLADFTGGYYGQIAIWSDDGDVDLDQTALPLARFIARHDPARVLADVQAKRAILRQYEEAVRVQRFGEGQVVLALASVVHALVQQFADHPAFDKAWLIDVSPAKVREHDV
jgi:hypothetical protein